MATIHVNRAGTTLGTFSEQDVRDGLRSGRFQGTDLGWREGMAAWQPLSQFSEFAPDLAATPPPPPVASTPPAVPPPLLTSTPGATASAGAIPPASEPVTPETGLPWDQRASKGFF